MCTLYVAGEDKRNIKLSLSTSWRDRGGNRGKTPLILKLCARRRWETLPLWSLGSQKRLRCPLNSRLNKLRNKFGRFWRYKNLLPFPGIPILDRPSRIEHLGKLYALVWKEMQERPRVLSFASFPMKPSGFNTVSYINPWAVKFLGDTHSALVVRLLSVPRINVETLGVNRLYTISPASNHQSLLDQASSRCLYQLPNHR